MKTAGARRLGVQGEEIAARHLAGLGWTIIARNWACSNGEIDIIARDDKGAVVFCEVKTRAGLGFGDPLEAITYKKIIKLRQLAAQWLTHQRLGIPKVRIDAIGVLISRSDRPRIHHIEGVVP